MTPALKKVRDMKREMKEGLARLHRVAQWGHEPERKSGS